jgi:hypothetical protein
MFATVLLAACACNDGNLNEMSALQGQVDSLKRIVDSSATADHSEDKSENLLGPGKLRVYGFCVIKFMYKYQVGGNLKQEKVKVWKDGLNGPPAIVEEDRLVTEPIRDTAVYYFSTSDIIFLDNTEDSKAQFKDNFVSSWRSQNNKFSYGGTQCLMLSAEIFTKPDYASASRDRDRFIFDR